MVLSLLFELAQLVRNIFVLLKKMHRCLHAGTKITEYGNVSNIGPFAEINHRKIVRGPQSLVSRSDVGGPGLFKVAERKEAARLLLQAHSGKGST